jgi:Ca2+-binding RTX toxin-like protein
MSKQTTLAVMLALLASSIALPSPAAAATITGTLGPNTLNGTAVADVINGLAGADKLYGNGGNDSLYGGAGNDTLVGGPGNDLLYGGAGDDWIHVVNANDGADRVYGDLGADFIELTIGDVVVYTSYQQSGQGYGTDRIITQHALDPWTIDFSGFDANVMLAGTQKLRFNLSSAAPRTGEISYIHGGIFNSMIVGLQANVDGDSQPEFQVYFGWEGQKAPVLII